MSYYTFCDESGIDGTARYMAIGGVWIHDRVGELSRIRKGLDDCKWMHGISAEMKWGKVSQDKLAAYKAFVDEFFGAATAMDFRCIIVDKHVLNYRKFHNNNKELGFYKFYFLLLSRNLSKGSDYYIYTDDKSNRRRNRLGELQTVVNNWANREMKCWPVKTIEPRESHQDVIIQMVDVLLGAVSSRWNNAANVNRNVTKDELAGYIAKKAGLPDLKRATTRMRRPLNIWVWQSK